MGVVRLAIEVVEFSNGIGFLGVLSREEEDGVVVWQEGAVCPVFPHLKQVRAFLQRSARRPLSPHLKHL